MNFIISKTSDPKYFDIQHFSTLQDLINFVDDIGNEVIIKTADSFWLVNTENTKGFSEEQITSCNYELEIYDDWRE